MWTNSLLKKFNLRVAGDDGEGDDPQDPPANDDKNKNENNSGGEQDDPPKKEDEDDKLDFDSLDEKTKKYIKKLRDENASRRTEYNNLSSKMERFEKGFKTMFGEEDDDVEPEERLNQLQGEYETSVSENAILRLALENGITGSENLEYFEFLMSKKLNSLEEGEEMTEDDLDDVLSKCSKSAVSGNTSTNDAGKGGKGPDKNNDGITQAEFDKMTVMQKSVLYQKNPALYEKLRENSSVM